MLLPLTDGLDGRLGEKSWKLGNDYGSAPGTGLASWLCDL